MIEEGFFAADERFELLNGLIVHKMSRNPPHDSGINRARRRLEKLLPAGWMIRVQSAITTTDSEPEPDIAVVRGDDPDYEMRHPGPADIGLLIEVANTTLDDDRALKLQIYARALIQPYWILNLAQSKLEVYTDPTGPAEQPSYKNRRDLGSDDSVNLSLPGEPIHAIPVSDFFPARKK